MNYGILLRSLPQYILLIIQLVGLIYLYINTEKMAKDPNGEPYYKNNVIASVLVSIPLLVALLITFSIIPMSYFIISERTSIN